MTDETADKVEYFATPGPALRIRHFDELGMPEPVTLTKREAKRLTYLRDQWIGDSRHRVFIDAASDNVYAILVYARESEEKK